MSKPYVLGIGYSTHDISTCLMRDGEIVVAVARERISRYKHDGGVSGAASWDASDCIDYCLDAANIRLEDVELFVESHLRNAAFDDFHARSVSGFRRPYPAERSVMISHHLAHAYSAYYGSGFDDAAVLVVDGEGNSLAAVRDCRGEDAEHLRAAPAAFSAIHPSRTEKISIYSVSDGRFEVIRKDFSAGSLGGAYQLATLYVFDDRNEAGKTMGLAPFGRPDVCEVEFIRSDGEGGITYPYLADAMNIVMPPPAKKWPEDPAQWDDERKGFADLAWKVQDDLERALVDLAASAQRTTKKRKLCIAGGVGLNSVANKMILDRAGFAEVFIMPPAGDDGISIGCAYWGSHRGLGDRAAKRARGLGTVSVGRRYPEAELSAAIASDTRIRAVRLEEPELLARTVGALAEGKIVGWFQGGSEIGPRALGHRSILADARHPNMKEILNRRVKFREGFRPFAPAVTLERSKDYFDLDHPSPYMLLIAPVHERERARLPSITHVDGTARVQTLTEAQNGRFYRLVKAFGEHTGVPVVVNTSFNIKGEPIVETPRDAIECFLCNDMDLLLLEDYVVEKVQLGDASLLAARPHASPRIVVNEESACGTDGWEVTRATVAFRENREHRFDVTPTFAEVLQRMNGERTVGELAAWLAERYELPTEESERMLLATVRDALSKNLLRLHG